MQNLNKEDKMESFSSENMVRIRDKKLLDKIAELYALSRCTTRNEFFNLILKNYAFKEDKQEEILEQLDALEDKTNAILEIMKNNGR